MDEDLAELRRAIGDLARHLENLAANIAMDRRNAPSNALPNAADNVAKGAAQVRETIIRPASDRAP